MALAAERTTFSLDVIGRYTANTWQEVVDSADATKDPHARPFDVFVIGGGTFGCVAAARLFARDRSRSHRILVIDAGPVALPEHVQNLPAVGAAEVWGVPWSSDSPRTWNRQFPGLAYCIGGRSVFWGGWSPHFIDSELPSPPWPPAVKEDLTTDVLEIGSNRYSYLDHAAIQIGAAATNDFVHGHLHDAMRAALFDGLRAAPPGSTALVGSRGTPMDADSPDEQLVAELEAPLAVESTSPRAGFLPFNKFSTVPLMVRSARLASEESHGEDVRKRLMVLANTHVVALDRDGDRITGIRTERGYLPVPPGGVVLLALGTIENTRMALDTLENRNGLVGRNLMAHLRSNLTFRVRRRAFGSALDVTMHPETKELQVSALFAKGLHEFDDGTRGHFHVQITASGVGETGRDSEVELFKKVPDIDLVDRFRDLTDEWIVVTLRGIGEMQPDRAGRGPNRITLGPPEDPLDFGRPRAVVSLEAGPEGSKDLQLWDAMDDACDRLALMFAQGDDIEYLSGPGPEAVWQKDPPGPDNRRDKLSSTHHEAGTLWMGDDASTSVTDHTGRFHEVENLYALGPCLLPTVGSPNPVLSGVALARRTIDRLPHRAVTPPEPGFEYLFDGTERTFKRWQSAGKGSFFLVDGMIVAHPGPGLGLLYYAAGKFENFVLRLQFRLHEGTENSGVFVRFRDPRRRVPDRFDPAKSYVYDNKAYVAVDTGYEVQIDELARGSGAAGDPDGLDEHRTGAFYDVPLGEAVGQQVYERPGLAPPLAWNDCEIEVLGDAFTVRLNGRQVSSFTNKDPKRGLPPSIDPESGFVGLQAHTGRIAFRDIVVRRLS